MDVLLQLHSRWRHDTQHNDTHHNLSVIATPSIMTLNTLCWRSFKLNVIDAECHWCWMSLMLNVIDAECHWCWMSFMLNVIGAECHWCWMSLMLNVIDAEYSFIFSSSIQISVKVSTLEVTVRNINNYTCSIMKRASLRLKTCAKLLQYLLFPLASSVKKNE